MCLEELMDLGLGRGRREGTLLLCQFYKEIGFFICLQSALLRCPGIKNVVHVTVAVAIGFVEEQIVELQKV